MLDRTGYDRASTIASRVVGFDGVNSLDVIEVRPIMDRRQRLGGVTSVQIDGGVEDLQRELAPQVLGALVGHPAEADPDEPALRIIGDGVGRPLRRGRE